MTSDTSPKLTVRLETDPAGRPVVLAGPDHRHYKVVFEVENAPPDTYAATFDLDPETYSDPSRTLRPDAKGRFLLKTTTYGDYPLVVRLRRSRGEDIMLRANVASGLRAAHGPAGGDVRQALEYISAH